MLNIDKIILRFFSLKNFCSKREKVENIDDLENINWETSK